MRGKRADRGPIPKPQSYDLHASDAKISESEDFGTLAIVKLEGAGKALGLEIGQYLGESVRLFTADSARTIDGELLEVKLKWKNGAAEISAKVSGTKKLGEFVGTNVALENVQLHIPEVDGKSAAAGERAEADPEQDAAGRPFDPGPLCSKCDHPWAWTAGMIAKSKMTDAERQKLKILKVNGHQRSSGKCFVTGCRCGAFMP